MIRSVSGHPGNWAAPTRPGLHSSEDYDLGSDRQVVVVVPGAADV